MNVEIELTTKKGYIHEAACIYKDEVFFASSKKKSPIPMLCRILIDEGFPQDGTFIVKRGETQIFVNPLTVSVWSQYDFVDDEKRSAHKIKFRTFEGMGNEADR